jgi:hypothetical protein
MEVVTHFKVQLVELSTPYMKHLRAHPRDLTRTSQLASCKRSFSGSGSDETSVDNGFFVGFCAMDWPSFRRYLLPPSSGPCISDYMAQHPERQPS